MLQVVVFSFCGSSMRFCLVLQQHNGCTIVTIHTINIRDEILKNWAENYRVYITFVLYGYANNHNRNDAQFLAERIKIGGCSGGSNVLCGWMAKKT